MDIPINHISYIEEGWVNIVCTILSDSFQYLFSIYMYL